MDPYGAKQTGEEKTSRYSCLPGVMCWAMKSINAATRQKMPGEPQAMVHLLRVSHLAQLTPQDTTLARVQMPPALRHTRGPPESPCPNSIGEERCHLFLCQQPQTLTVLHDRPALPQKPTQPCLLLRSHGGLALSLLIQLFLFNLKHTNLSSVVSLP